MNPIKKLFIIFSTVFVVLLILTTVLLLNMYRYPFGKPGKSNNSATAKIPELKPESIQRFVNGIQVPTISKADYGKTDFPAFEKYIQVLKENYPIVFSTMSEKRINRYALVLHWKGTNSRSQPILFLAHLDVVNPGDEKRWKQSPFLGTIHDKRLYGRGTLDMKNMLHGILETCDEYIKKGFVPTRDIYLAFGQDEEVGGKEGAVKIAQYFKAEGLRFEAIFDEGGLVAKKGSLKGIQSDIAMIGVGEKGFLSAVIRVKGNGGHSSMPPLESTMGQAAQIMINLEKNQMPLRLVPSIEIFLSNIGGAMSFPSRLAIANQWLMKPILLEQLAKNPATNAIVRTTTALTMMKGSEGTNVIAPEVEFVVNFRILPGDTVEDVRLHIKEASKDYVVEIKEVSNTRGASNISKTDVSAYKTLEKVIQEIYPEAIVSPYITIGGTDAFKYGDLSDNIYRFNPVILDAVERTSIHNYNESIHLENYQRTIHYYRLLIDQFNK